jgi:hypothetical protein
MPADTECTGFAGRVGLLEERDCTVEAAVADVAPIVVFVS